MPAPTPANVMYRLCLLLLVLVGWTAGSAWAGQSGPGIEERPTVTPGLPAADGAALRSTVSSDAGSSPDISVTVFEQFQQFQMQIEALTGRIEQLEHALQQSSAQERARYVDLDSRIRALEQAAKQRPVDASSASVPGAVEPTDTEQIDPEKAQFDRALSLVRAQKYDDAIDAFQQQLKQFPRGELAPVAMYWLGEMWLVASRPDVAKAGRFFRRVYNEYPKSSRASLAMYRHGLIQCQNDEVPSGRVTLNKVIVQYPGSQDAKAADIALKQQCK